MKFSRILSTAACLALACAVPAPETEAAEISITNSLVNGRGEYPNNKAKTGENQPSINVTFIGPEGNIAYTKVPTLLGRPHTFSHPANVSEVKVEGQSGYEFDKHCRLYAMDGAHHTTQVGTTDYYRLDQTSVLTSICCTGGDYFDNVERSIEIPDDTLLARDTAPPNILVTLVLYNGTEVESKTVSLDGVGVVFDYPAAISKIKVSNYQFDHFCQVNGTDTAHPTSQTDKDVYRLDYPCVVKYISCKSGGEYHSSSSTTTYLPTPTYKPVPTYTPDSKATPDTGKTIVHVTFITETHETRAIHVYANGQEETLVLPGKILSIIVPDYEFGKFCQLKGPEGVLVTVKERSHIGTYNFHHPTVVTSIRCHSGGEVTHPVEHVEFVDTNGTVTKVTIPRDNKYRHNTIAKGKIARITAEDPTSLRRCCFLVGRYEGLIGPQFAPLDLEHIGKGPQEIESYKCAEKNLYHLFERDSLCFGSGEMEWAN